MDLTHKTFTFITLSLVTVCAAWAFLNPVNSPIHENRWDHKVSLTGTVVSVIRHRTDGLATHLGQVRLVQSDLDLGSYRVQLMMRGLAASADISPGTRVRCRGYLKVVRPTENPGSGSYGHSLLSQGIVASLSTRTCEVINASKTTILYDLRSRVRSIIRTGFSEASQPLMEALILGDSGMLDPAARTLWRRAGLSHLLAISGLHVGFLSMLLYRLSIRVFSFFSMISARWDCGRFAAVIGILGAWLYVGIAGSPISAVRAGWMITGLLSARILHQYPDPESAICLAAWCIFCVEPRAVTDVGCQLSFSAVIALLIAQAPVREALGWAHDHLPYLGLVRLMSIVLSTCIMSLICILGTLPVLIWHFQQVAWVGIFSNVLAIPVVAWGVVIPGIFTVFLELFGLGVGGLVGHTVVDQCVVFGFKIAAWFGVSAPWVVPRPAPFYMLFWVFFVMACLSVFHVKRRYRFRLTLIALVALAIGIWNPRTKLWVDGLTVTFLHVGHGDAAVVQLPSGFTLLIDSGGDPTGRFDVGQRTVLPALLSMGISRIDALVFSHPHADHIFGAGSVIASMPVGEVWTNGCTLSHPAARDLKRSVDKASVPVRKFHGAESVKVGDATIDILHPLPCRAHRSDNDNSLVLKVSLGNFSVLFTGDIERWGERQLLSSGVDLRSTVLKVPHHGSRTSSSDEFIVRVQPRIAVTQAQDGGRFRLPHPAVEQRYFRWKIPLWVTGRYGAMTVWSNGSDWLVRGQ